jgi:hypothetical protein
MAEVVYILCAVASLGCALILFRSYLQARSRLLLLSTLCFAGMCINSAILVIDLLVLPELDLRLARTVVAYISLLGLLLGLIWESR